MIPIHGSTDPRFQAVRDAFTADFRNHGEVGAAYVSTSAAAE